MLEFAEIHDGQPIHISRARASQVGNLFCPYCRKPVTAITRMSTPRVPVPHFAHAGAACGGESLVIMPLYTNFEGADDVRSGELPLADFYTIQQEAIRTQVTDMQERDDGEHKLLQWTIQKFSLFTLYFVEIQRTSSDLLYHIGSTDQAQEAYLAMLAHELADDDVHSLHPLSILPGMAALEFYIAYRFRAHCWKFKTRGSLPDYFGFLPDELQLVLDELAQLRYRSSAFRNRIKAGMQRAKASGKRLGRPPESPQRFLRKARSQTIVSLLQRGLGVREINRQTGYAINTVRKVRDMINREVID